MYWQRGCKNYEAKSKKEVYKPWIADIFTKNEERNDLHAPRRAERYRR